MQFCTQIETFEVVDAGTSTPFTIAFKMNRCLMTLLVTIWWSGSIQRIPIKLVFHRQGLGDQIRVKKAIVFWSKNVWFSQTVLRLSFIVWLAVKKRLSTGDRMITWSIQQGCVLCGESNETRDRVFVCMPLLPYGMGQACKLTEWG